MKIDIPKIIEGLRLGDYAPEFGEAVLCVWVNPPRRLREAYTQAVEESVDALRQAQELSREALEDEILASLQQRVRASEQKQREWFAEIWSQGPEGTGWTLEEIDELAASDSDPALLPWLIGRTVAMIGEHRSASKKASTPRSARSPSAA